MKIRISGNTIRFRLRQPEVKEFQQKGTLTEVTAFGPAPADQLRFSLEITLNPQLEVNFGSNTTTVKVPKQLAEEWVTTERVGFDGKVETESGYLIEVLVEKDFVCLDRPEDEQAGAYANPKAIC